LVMRLVPAASAENISARCDTDLSGAADSFPVKRLAGRAVLGPAGGGEAAVMGAIAVRVRKKLDSGFDSARLTWQLARRFKDANQR